MCVPTFTNIPALHKGRLCPVLVDIQPAQRTRQPATVRQVMEETCDHLDHIVVGRLPPCLVKLLAYGSPAKGEVGSVLGLATDATKLAR